MENKFGKWDKIDIEYVGAISKDEIREIMYLRDKGKNSREIANDLGLTLVIVNKAIEKNSGKIELLKEEKKYMETQLIKRPDELEDIKDSDIVQLSRSLLNSMVQSTDLIRPQELTSQKLQEAKVLLGFLNSTANAMKMKMQFFKMIGLADKVKAVQEKSKNL